MPFLIMQGGCGQAHGYFLVVTIDDIAFDTYGPFVLLCPDQGAVRPAEVRAQYVPAGDAPDFISRKPGQGFKTAVQEQDPPGKVHDDDSEGQIIHNGMQFNWRAK